MVKRSIFIFNRMDRLLPFHHRYYFQSILMGQTYRGDGSVMRTAVLSDDGSTLNFASEEFLAKAGLEPIGVSRGTIKQLKDEVTIEAPLYRLQFKLASAYQTVATTVAISTQHIGHREPVPEEIMQVMCELF